MKPSAQKAYPAHEETLAEQLDPNTSLGIMAQMVGRDKCVLDVGCASGYFARVAARNGCTVVGIDVNPAAVEAARAHCSEAIVADVESAPLAEILGEKKFDVVVCGDVLEHLMNPARLLEGVRDVLAEGGYLVASFPNVAHGSVRLSLLNGQFDYQDEGLLDDTHVRFFTLKSVDEILLSTGYHIDVLERATMDIFARSDVLPPLDPSAFEKELVARVERDPEAKTLQFVVKAFPLSQSARQKALFKRFSAANTQLSNARVVIEARDREIEALRLRVAELSERGSAEFLQHAYEAQIRALESAFAELLEAEVSKTREQADQIEAYIASGNAHRS